jgi:hypothetical protein
MSRRPPSTYLTADELKQIAAIKYSEAVSTAPGPEQQLLVSAHRYQNLAEMERCLASKELEPEMTVIRGASLLNASILSRS